MTLTISLAHHRIRLEHTRDEIRCALTDFLVSEAASACDKIPPLCLSITKDDLAEERNRVARPASAGYWEFLALERAAARALAPLGVLHMHAVAVAVDTECGWEACVFLAASGEGKSTHVRHWLTLLGDRAMIVADDKPFLSYEGNKLLVHGSPWRGKEGWGENLSVPVRGFCILRRGDEDLVWEADSAEAMQEWFSRVFLPEDPVAAAAVLAVTDRVLSTVPFWCLSCTDSPHAAEVAYTAIMEKE